MRAALLAAVVAAACGSPHASPSYITIGADAVTTAQAIAAHDHATFSVLATSGDVAVLAIDPAELDALSAALHQQFHRCGGFMVHDSLADARAALEPAATRPALDYTLDRGDQVRAALPALDRERIVQTIRELSALKNRYYQSTTGAWSSEWLRARWRSYTRRPDVTVELVDHGYAQKSVILTIPGTTRADQVVVLGGHLDSINMFGGKSATAPGADDDASGIATLDEIARVLLVNDYRPERTVKIMAYAAEEVGLRGSLSIAKDFQKRGIDVVGALQLDMTNYQGSDTDIWLMRDFTNAAQNAFVGRLIDTYVGASWDYDACGYACSDHASWDRYGVPASMPFESRKHDMNRKIHTTGDTLETSDANAHHAIKFARLGLAYAIELAKGELGLGA
ncbi:MAG: M20/M25/M40 family metallo-hydrolase [Acidobacteriota bacterium]